MGKVPQAKQNDTACDIPEPQHALPYSEVFSTSRDSAGSATPFVTAAGRTIQALLHL